MVSESEHRPNTCRSRISIVKECMNRTTQTIGCACWIREEHLLSSAAFTCRQPIQRLRVAITYAHCVLLQARVAATLGHIKPVRCARGISKTFISYTYGTISTSWRSKGRNLETKKRCPSRCNLGHTMQVFIVPISESSIQ